MWTILGGVLSNTTSANNRTVFILGLIDPLLVLIMFGALWKTFGWRSMCFALIFFGTNEPARYFWTGGSFLRYDWLLSLALGICALHRERWKSAGFLLTLAGLLRIFPVLALGGVGLAWLARSIHTRSLRPTPAETRIALGALVAIALLLPLSLVATGNQNVWNEFVSNARKHLETPLTNHMGLKTALSYRDDLRSAVTFDNRLPDPFEAWKEGRRSTFHERRLLFFGVVSMIVLLIMWRSASSAPWEMAVLGTGLIPFMTELTCYYYSFFLLFALFWEKRSMPVIALLVFGWGSWKIAQFYPRYDECFTAMSIAALLVPLVAVWTAHPRASQIDTGHRETSRVE